MARTLSKGLAPVVERLELDRPEVVTLRDIEEICDEEGIGTEPRVVASRLKKAGWLLPTGQRGAWEFAPADLAGPYSACDPLLPVKAFAAANPKAAPLLRGQTAAWAMGLADRVPATVEVAMGAGAHATVPEGVSTCSYRTALPPRRAKGVLSLSPRPWSCRWPSAPPASGHGPARPSGCPTSWTRCWPTPRSPSSRANPRPRRSARATCCREPAPT